MYLSHYFLFKIGVFCWRVGIEKHIRKKVLHGEIQLVSQDIVLFKTDGIDRCIDFF